MVSSQKGKKELPRFKKRAEPEPSADEINASCRWFITLLIGKSAVWLLIGTLMRGFALVELIFPDLTPATAPALSYGRLCASASTALLYGFAFQALVAISFYSTCLLGRSKIQNRALVYGSIALWNIGVLSGAIGALFGDSTGYEWFELPHYSGTILIAASALFAVGLILLISNRSQPLIHPSLWFGIILPFGMFITITASQLFLVRFPTGGVQQFLIHNWLKNISFNSLLSGEIIGAVFYFLYVSKANLYSRRVALFSFFGLLILGGFGGISPSIPLPRWIFELSRAMYLLMIIPLAATFLNVGLTLLYSKKIGDTKFQPCPSLYFTTALISVGLFIIFGIAESSTTISRIVEFTLFSTGREFLLLFCGVVFTFVGFVETLLPALHNKETTTAAPLQMWIIIGGGLTLCISFLLGGFVQGASYYDYSETFIDAVNSVKPFLFLGLLANTVIVAALLLFLFRNGLIIIRAISSKITNLKELNRSEVIGKTENNDEIL
ncbi:MAG: cbb3-type cytochrome c oxidase subunit I [Verrucomicrobiia bacterium]